MRHIPADEQAPRGCEPPQDAAGIDADVPSAVGRVLAAELRARVTEAAGVDAVFARDIAERVARFTLGGKRTRSQFLWWGLRAAGFDGSPARVRAALRIAGALELLQTCALVHDDVMDGSALRRGRPSVHRDLAEQYGRRGGPGGAESFGGGGAILVGDLALVWADDLVADTALPPDIRRRVDGVWRALRTEVVAGQYLDLLGQATGARSTAQAVRTACLKSALYSVERPLALGAALAGADGALCDALSAAGRQAGIAFQLRDDLLGAFGDPAITGKPSGQDIRQGKPNYLIAVARERAEAAGDHAGTALLDAAARGEGAVGEETVRPILDLLVSTGARAAVEARITRLVAHSAEHLAAATGIAPAPRARLLSLFRRAAGLGDPAEDPCSPAPRERPADAEAHDGPADEGAHGGPADAEAHGGPADPGGPSGPTEARGHAAATGPGTHHDQSAAGAPTALPDDEARSRPADAVAAAGRESR